MRIRPLAGALGAEVFDLDLATELDRTGPGAAWDELYGAFLRYSVLVVRDQRLSPDQQVAVAARFGAPQPDPMKVGVDGVMEVSRIVKEPDEVENFGHQWHMDMSFLATPPKASLLLACEAPEVGGDTIFASLTKACACLSEGLRALADRLTLVHENWPNDLGRFKGISTAPRTYKRVSAERALISPHPETDCPRLMISPYYARQFKDMTLEESAPLIGYLNDWTTSNDFNCRVRWEPGTLTIWDNRAVIHDVPSDDFAARLEGSGFRRVMHRVTVSE